MRVSVFGTGYLGATHAAGMAELGHEVIGVDVDAAKVATLSRGEVPFYEPGLPELMSSFWNCPKDMIRKSASVARVFQGDNDNGSPLRGRC